MKMKLYDFFVVETIENSIVKDAVLLNVSLSKLL